MGGERAGRRTPCAERAVILTAVQSLRLHVRRGSGGESGESAAPAGAVVFCCVRTAADDAG